MKNLPRKNIVFVIDSLKSGGAEKLVLDKIKFLRNLESYNIECIKLQKAIHLKNMFTILSNLLSIFHKKYFAGHKILFHCHMTKAIYLSPILKFIFQSPIIITEHNTWSPRRRFKFLFVLESMIYRRADIVVSVSKAVKNSLHNWLRLNYNDLITSLVIYNGVEPPSLDHINSKKIVKKSNHLDFLAVGSLTEQKGFDILLWHLHSYKKHNFHLKIAGVGSEYKRLNNLVAKYGLSENVTFLGFVDDLSEYYLQADVFLISSRWEGFGLIAVEALSYGLPIVWSRVNGLNEVLYNCKSCFSYELGNQNEFNNSINSATIAFKSSNTYKTSISHSKKFRFDSMAKKYLKLYEELF